MIVLRDPASAASLLCPDIRSLVETRFTQLCDGSDDPYDA